MYRSHKVKDKAFIYRRIVDKDKVKVKDTKETKPCAELLHMWKTINEPSQALLDKTVDRIADKFDMQDSRKFIYKAIWKLGRVKVLDIMEATEYSCARDKKAYFLAIATRAIRDREMAEKQPWNPDKTNRGKNYRRNY